MRNIQVKTRTFEVFYRTEINFVFLNALQKHICVFWLCCIYGGRTVTRYSAVTDYMRRITAVFIASVLNLILTEMPDILSGPL